jgi:hypothetical protein
MDVVKVSSSIHIPCFGEKETQGLGQLRCVFPVELWSLGPWATSTKFLFSIQQFDLYPVCSPFLSFHTKNGSYLPEVLSRWQAMRKG